METVIARATVAGQSPAVVFLLYLAPVAVTVAAIAGWRKSVPGAAMLASFGAAYCLWLLAPLGFTLPETRQLSQYASILGWLWLVVAWGRHVLTEWPTPMWGHWFAGTVLLALPLVGLVAALTP